LAAGIGEAAGNSRKWKGLSSCMGISHNESSESAGEVLPQAKISGMAIFRAPVQPGSSGVLLHAWRNCHEKDDPAELDTSVVSRMGGGAI
jgi:hypothetical protein